MSFAIRRAVPSDRANVLALHRALYVDYRRSITPPGVEPLFAYRDMDAALGADADALLRATDALVLLAEDGEEVVGYISGRVEVDEHRVLPRKGVIEDWFVVPSARATGVGRRLYEALVAVFREARCDVVESTTQAFNALSRRVHEHLGFVEIEIKYRRRL